MTNLIQTLLPLLQVDRFFPNVSVALMSREEFVQTYITQADVTLFTGKLSNAQHHAATKTIDARLFCSGQDCAAPDTILVHRYQVSTFVKYLKEQLKNIKIGDYSDPEVRVGKLADHGQIQVISSLLLKLNDYIVYGGCIDYHSSIIHPTIIVAPLSERINYQELFSPVFIISVYDNDDQLAEYFEQPKYIENDIMGASFVSANKKIVPKPVLVPRDIYMFL
ncbi:Aldehyde/histidinol dehydrogenase, partial [Tricladium varicosporioides]